MENPKSITLNFIKDPEEEHLEASFGLSDRRHIELIDTYMQLEAETIPEAMNYYFENDQFTFEEAVYMTFIIGTHAQQNRQQLPEGLAIFLGR